MGSVSVTVDVDVDEVIDEIDTEDLVDELKARAGRGDKVAQAVLSEVPPMGALSSWEAEELALAVKRDDPRRVIDLMREMVR